MGPVVRVMTIISCDHAAKFNGPCPTCGDGVEPYFPPLRGTWLPLTELFPWRYREGRQSAGVAMVRSNVITAKGVER